jgi:hypothetical protein
VAIFPAPPRVMLHVELCALSAPAGMRGTRGIGVLSYCECGGAWCLQSRWHGDAWRSLQHGAAPTTISHMGATPALGPHLQVERGEVEDTSVALLVHRYGVAGGCTACDACPPAPWAHGTVHCIEAPARNSGHAGCVRNFWWCSQTALCCACQLCIAGSHEQQGPPVVKLTREAAQVQGPQMGVWSSLAHPARLKCACTPLRPCHSAPGCVGSPSWAA